MLITSIKKLVSGENLTEQEMMDCMESIMTGEESDTKIASFLTALTIKGESIEEITGGAKVLRSKAAVVNLDDLYTVDVVGTGGDNYGTYNISTAASFITSAAGVPVIKHGNRSVSSKCGSADVLEALGININIKPEQAQECVRKIGISFLFAPLYHNAMKHVAPVRRELGFRTIFNILGPLTNPAKAKAQIMGVFDEDLVEPLANVLKNVGVDRALVVHGKDGLDELTITNDTRICELKEGKIESYYLNPEKLGIQKGNMEDIIGGNAEENAEIIRNLFKGEKGPKRDILVLNAGAAIYIGNKAKSLQEGIEIAKNIIDSNKAMEKLEAFIKVSNSYN